MHGRDPNGKTVNRPHPGKSQEFRQSALPAIPLAGRVRHQNWYFTRPPMTRETPRPPKFTAVPGAA